MVRGGGVNLGVLHLAPVFAYLMGTPEDQTGAAQHPSLLAWWQRMSARESMARTHPQFA